MSTEINYLAVALATIVQFAVGGAWYMSLFAKAWGEIHGFDKLSKAEQKEKQSHMMPYMVAQVVITALTTFVLAKFIIMLPSESVYKLAVLSWIGFVVPTQVAAVMFGGTEPKWIAKKVAIMSAGSLACLLVGSLILHAIK